MIKTPSFEIAANIAGDPNASKTALLLPGRLDTKDYVNFTSHLEVLASLGYYALVIDVPGTWDSPGDIADYSTTLYVSVVNELIETLGNRPTLLLGHSRGGGTAMVASENPHVEGLVLVNAAYGEPSPPNPDDIVDGVHPEERDLPPGNVRTKEKKTLNLPLAYFKDGAKYDTTEYLKRYAGPKLVVHATDDEFKPFEEVKSIFEGLSDPKEFLRLDCAHDYRLDPASIEAVDQALVKFVQNI